MSKDKSKQAAVRRAEERGDSKELIGKITCKDKDGNVIPLLDDNGDEIIAVATGSAHKKN